MECNTNLSAITKLVQIERYINRLNLIYSKCDETCLQLLDFQETLSMRLKYVIEILVLWDPTGKP